MITFKAKTANGEIIKSALSPFNFPAGEAHVKREERRELEPTEIAILQPTADSIHDDLFALSMWEDYISRTYAPLDPKRPKIVAVVPYFPGARADRGEPFGAQVYAMHFYNLQLDQIILLDPHSPVIVDELTYLMGPDTEITVVNSDEVLTTGVAPIFNFSGYAGIIAPDKGAVPRATAVADALGLPVFKAGKTRDEATGKLSGFSCEPLPEFGKFLLIDDICDGGGTFLGLADATGLAKERLDLYVTHGVFSKEAVNTLPEKFGKIFTTNSYAPTRNLNTEPDSIVNLSNQPFVRMDITRLLISKTK